MILANEKVLGIAFGMLSPIIHGRVRFPVPCSVRAPYAGKIMAPGPSIPPIASDASTVPRL